MASTASAGRPGLVGGGMISSSFSQFRVNQFVDNSVKPNDATDAAPQTTALFKRRDQEAEMSQAPRPSSGQTADRPPLNAPARSSHPDRNQANSSPAMELVEVASNPVIEGVLGPNKDGRVRNPVPSKLKGKTDNKQGNFGVMHMGMSPGGKKSEAQGRDAAAERDAAARRTSENTASRAKAMQSDKYVPPKKRGLEASLNDAHGNTSRESPFSISRDDHRQRSRPLAPDETKIEQARLLTLLRSINPVTVVDQICKAVAYFGGIPGAPPPEDGIFPESANTRETGALFIGWIAEIFPDVNASRSPEIGADSKKKKGGAKGKAGANGESSLANEPPNSRNGYGFGPAVSAPGWGLPQSLALVNTPVPVAPISLPDGRQAAPPVQEQSKPPEQQQATDTPVKLQLEEVPDLTAAGNKRRRGRPKGSRNKGKDGQGDADIGGSGTNQGDGQDQGQIHQAPQAQMMTPQAAQPAQNINPYGTPSTVQQGATKPSPALTYANQTWQNSSQQNQPVNNMVVPAADELSPEERAVLEAFRHHGPDRMNLAPSPVVPAKPTPEVGQKRKRPPPKPKAVPAAAPTASPAQVQTQVQAPTQSYGMDNSQVVQNTTALPLSNDNTMALAKDAMQWASMNSTPTMSTTSAPPPAKRVRQRKPKAPVINDPPARTQTASVVSSATPPIAKSTIPESTAPSTQTQSYSQQSMSQQSMPVQPVQPVQRASEGLEAHFERFQNFSSQQNGRSNTPTVSQQQVRQQPKPPSVTPQQSTPQMQQQQMQPQKSQQGSQQSLQRDEQKTTQGPAARPSSTTNYYSQRNTASTNYSQQYPSHQNSQLYGATAQASPQMSTTSYRTSSAMSQASPQFSQAETSYRTASPHTIAQPSPSYSQTDTTSNFRTNSTHSSLAQPASSYSQAAAENAYRTPSTHSMTQPSQAYSSTRTQPTQQQTHYNHYSDSSYIDLPTLESLGHTGNTSTSTSNLGLTTQGYGQQPLGVGLGGSSSASRSSNTNSLYGTSSATNNSLYGTSAGLGNAFDTTSANDLLRGVSRSTGTGSASVYGSASSAGLGGGYHTSTSDHEMQERMLRTLGRR